MNFQDKPNNVDFLKKRLILPRSSKSVRKSDRQEQRQKPKLSFEYLSEHGNARNKILSLAVFAAMILLIIIPVKAFQAYAALNAQKQAIFQTAQAATDAMRTAGNFMRLMELKQAHQTFIQALGDFSEAQSTLQNLPSWARALLTLSPKDEAFVRAGDAILQAGKDLAMSGRFVASALDVWEQEGNEILPKLSQSRLHLSSALPYLQHAEATLDSLDTNALPQETSKGLGTVKTLLPLLKQGLTGALATAETGQYLLGENDLRRYLLVFQNNGELRATGGFMGSFALVDMLNGKIKNIEIPGGGFYDLRAGVLKRVIPPKPLTLLSPLWEAQDANWWPDFPASSEKILWFYEQAANRTVDGVIAVNASVLTKLLAVLGPITLPKYDVALTQENVIDELQNEVDLEYDKESNRPKQIIADLAPILIEKLLSVDSSTRKKLFDALLLSLEEKDIQLYFKDQSAESIVNALSWSGRVANIAPKDDYLLLLHSNLGGRKTDRVIQDTARYDLNIGETGDLTATLTLTRTHHGVKGDYFTGVGSVDYLRIYAPPSSNLIAANGFDTIDQNLFETPAPNAVPDAHVLAREKKRVADGMYPIDVYEESDKTVLGGWILLDPEATKTVSITYALPHRLDWENVSSSEPPISLSASGLVGKYSLLLQKQSGALPLDFIFTVRYPASWSGRFENIEFLAENAEEGNILSLEQIISKDTRFSLEFARNESSTDEAIQGVP